MLKAVHHDGVIVGNVGRLQDVVADALEADLPLAEVVEFGKPFDEVRLKELKIRPLVFLTYFIKVADAGCQAPINRAQHV